MIKIRKSVFETNSSSIHSIAIPKSNDISFKPEHIHFGFDDFGWEIEQVDNADYLYTAIVCCCSDEEIEELKNLIESELNKQNISCDFATPRFETYEWEGKVYRSLNGGYIDHYEGLEEFLSYLNTNKDKIVPYILNGRTFTGNDNIDSDETGSNQRELKQISVYNYNKGKCITKTVENPYYEKGNDNFDWIHKGN